ncbi:chaperonin 10-like protein [Fusarium tricinctum]|uniref:Chaperonin 10-like protein n=1 Tax=Fusarium tricinctum TaxID=61284 RepID=A0A8K0RZ46_9HYPO|nr:chaperonin 10-like protein [Fusarium tricinctum]
MSNSIFLTSTGDLVVQKVTETYKIEDSQCLVRVNYSGINHCDLNFFYMGLNSFVTGFEFSGIVEKAGSDTRFKAGDAVFGISPVAFPMPSAYGSHQDLMVAQSELLYHIPAGVSPKDASAICVAAHTATDALFNVIGAGFPAAGVSGVDPTGKGILIWGGASSVGIMAIQIAKAAGFRYIFTTASAKNHETLQHFGATHCFDYSSSTVVEDIRAAQRPLQIEITIAFDTVGKGTMDHGASAGPSSPELTKRALLSSKSDDLRLACTVPVPTDAAFEFCTSYRPKGNLNAMGAPQDPDSAVRVRKIIEYMLADGTYGLKVPVVTVVSDTKDGIGGIRRAAEGKMSLEKLVLKHPLK